MRWRGGFYLTVLATLLASAGSVGAQQRRALSWTRTGIVSVAAVPEVAEPLALTDEQVALASRLAAEDAERIANVFRGEPTAEERRERYGRYVEARRDAETKLSESLGEERYRRLRQMTYQVVGVAAAFTNGRVVEELNVSDEQRRRAFGILRDARDGLRAAVDRPEQLHKVRAELNGRLEELLSEEQREQWKRQVGPPVADELLSRIRVGVLSLGPPNAGRGDRLENRYEGLRTDDYLGEVRQLTKVRDDEVFTEGPAVAKDGTVYFTNVPMSKILRWEPPAGSLSIFRDNSNQTNGLCFDSSGRLLCCEGGAGRVTRTDMKSGEIEVLADRYNGFPLAAPNDLCLDRRGRIYFTSRPGVEDPSKGNVNAVYRIDPDGTLTRLLAWPRIHMPNGIVVSPDDETLYVIEAHPDADRHRDVRAYDLRRDGTLSNERVLIDFHPGRSGDGMCIDVQGNLYIAAGLHRRRDTSETLDTRPGIHVVSPDGKLLAFRETPEDTITNCAFGGPESKTLYVTCGSLLLEIPTSIAGRRAE